MGSPVCEREGETHRKLREKEKESGRHIDRRKGKG